VGGNSFTEGVLPVESVTEYFRHFPMLELDFTFYRLLLDKDLKPTPSQHLLKNYKQYLDDRNRIFLKVPQAVFARKLWRGGKFTQNPDYLNHQLFTRNFYEPANDILGQSLKGFIFEQEYQVKKDRLGQDAFNEQLQSFFSMIPRDDRYHIENRTSHYFTEEYFSLLETFGIGQVLSHWTWLPPLRDQFAKSGNRFLNSGQQSLIRLITPLKVRYAQSYQDAFPFDKMVPGMLSQRMVTDTVDLMQLAERQNVQINISVNNRAGGSAPLIARQIAKRFLERRAK
jgi:uncharacterized protein YecE (DUF72 family)